MIELLLNNDNELGLIIPFTNLSLKKAFLVEQNEETALVIETNREQPLIFGILDEEHILSVQEKGYVYVFEANDKKVLKETLVKLEL